MTTSRLALGSVSTLALAALAVGVAPMLLKRAWGSADGTPFGAISSFSGSLSTSTPVDGDRAQMLKLAALKSTTAAPDPAIASAAELTAAPAQPADPAPSAATTASVPAVAQPADTHAPVEMAAAEPASDAAPQGETVVPLPPSTPARSGGSLVNINTASADVLDRFPGAGRIGRAIVSHRPYRSVDDLVRKRVLRTSEFQKIERRISVD